MLQGGLFKDDNFWSRIKSFNKMQNGYSLPQFVQDIATLVNIEQPTPLELASNSQIRSYLGACIAACIIKINMSIQSTVPTMILDTSTRDLDLLIAQVELIKQQLGSRLLAAYPDSISAILAQSKNDSVNEVKEATIPATARLAQNWKVISDSHRRIFRFLEALKLIKHALQYLNETPTPTGMPEVKEHRAKTPSNAG